MAISRVFMIVDRYESGYGHGWKQDGLDLSKTPHGDAELGEAYQLGYRAGSEARERAKTARPGVARMINKFQRRRSRDYHADLFDGTPQALRPCWPEGLEMMKPYEVACDDKNNSEERAKLTVVIGVDGDAHVAMTEYHSRTDRCWEFPSVRLRTMAGGGKNHRTRQALLWLAKAIQLDEEERNGTPS